MRERWIRMKSLSGSLRLTDARLKEITDATSCQVDAGITSGSLYPLDFIHCRFEIVVLSPDKDILPFRASFVDV